MPSWIFSVETGLAGLSDDERTKVPAQQWLHHTAGVLTSMFALSVGQSPFLGGEQPIWCPNSHCAENWCWVCVGRKEKSTAHAPGLEAPVFFWWTSGALQ